VVLKDGWERGTLEDLQDETAQQWRFNYPNEPPLVIHSLRDAHQATLMSQQQLGKIVKSSREAATIFVVEADAKGGAAEMGHVKVAREAVKPLPVIVEAEVVAKNEEALKEGPLLVLDEKAGSWKDRYYVLLSDRLEQYKSKKDKNPSAKLLIAVGGVVTKIEDFAARHIPTPPGVDDQESSPTAFSFVPFPGGKEHIMACSSEAELVAWHRAVGGAILRAHRTPFVPIEALWVSIPVVRRANEMLLCKIDVKTKTTDRKEWTVEKTFEEIRDFHAQVKGLFPAQAQLFPALPQLIVGGNASTGTLEGRRAALQDFFTTLMGQPACVQHPVVQDFVDVYQKCEGPDLTKFE